MVTSTTSPTGTNSPSPSSSSSSTSSPSPSRTSSTTTTTTTGTTSPSLPTTTSSSSSTTITTSPTLMALSFFHPGAVVSYRSRSQITSGAGSQCVYDINGRLMLSAANAPNFGAGTLDASGPQSLYTFIKHVFADVIPFICMCKVQSNCAAYFEARPSINDTGYVAPRPPRLWGDPHFVSVDGLPFTFNGKGEYTLLTIFGGNFTVQARQQPTSTSGPNATAFTSFAARDRTAGFNDTVEVRVRTSNTLGHALQVLVNGQQVDFSFGPTAVYPAFTITASVAQGNQTSSVQGTNTTSWTAAQSTTEYNYVVVFFPGVQAQLTVFTDATSGWLSQVLYLPASFRGMTSGLLGNFNGVSTDDLRCANGTIIPSTAAPETVFEFGQTWMVTNSSSIFAYDIGTSYATYNDRNYRPSFSVTFASPALQQQAATVCQNNSQCLLDVAASGSVSFSGSSLVMQTLSRNIQQALALPPAFSSIVYTQYISHNNATGERRISVTVTVMPQDTTHTAADILVNFTAGAINASRGNCTLRMHESLNASLRVADCVFGPSVMFPMSLPLVASYADVAASSQATVTALGTCASNEYVSRTFYDGNITCTTLTSCPAGESVAATPTSNRVCMSAMSAGSSSNAAVIAGAVVAGIVILAAIVVAAVVLSRKDR